MTHVVITGTGLYTPEHAIDNAALVAAFNAWVDSENEHHAGAIARGEANRWHIQAANLSKKPPVLRAAMCSMHLASLTHSVCGLNCRSGAMTKLQLSARWRPLPRSRR
jgi:hypothetical protein